MTGTESADSQAPGGRCGREWCANDACQFNGVSRTHEEGVLGKAHLRLKRINAGERAQCEDWKKHGRKGAAKLVRGVAQPVAERMADAVMGSTNAGAWDVGVMRESFAKA